ncbi:MAG TPA: YkgJ family cysteine cluster protein [Candidatus Sulfopaludibacter sp.]|jgi:Fe-S-cluster containining protein|nr:YkgJ family cysteine cluster protein [Candidatus Sulfopaludibacter sp.]
MDSDLVQIVDAALAQAVARGGSWIACKPGCCDCCLGPFPISQSDAARLRAGLAELTLSDPARALRVRDRVRHAIDRIDEDDDPCPALDPEHGTCDLYAWRPLTCRTFGPAIRWNSDAVGICELCFVGATESQIADAAVKLDTPEDNSEETLVALALR